MKKDRLYTVNKGLASVVQKQAQPKNVFAFGTPSLTRGASWGLNDYNQATDFSGFGNYQPTVGKIDRVDIPNPSTPNAGIGKWGQAGLAVSGVLAPMAANYISDGYSNGAANTFMAAGNAVGQAIGTVNPVAGAIVSTASTLLGGLGNRAFGTKKNEGNINAITQNTTQAREAGNMLTGASTTSDLLNAAGNMTGSMGFGTTDLVKGGWFSKGKARRQGQKFLNKENAALAYQNQGMMLGANNVDSTLDNMVMGNFAAYGGPFEMASRMPYIEQNNSNDMGAIEYGFMSDYLINKQRQAEMKNKVGGVNSLPANMFSDGGIEIKHPGRLTRLKERTGKTEAELYNDGNPAHKKMVVFARNSRRWSKHALGGYLKGNIYDIPEEEVNRLIAAGYEVEYL